MIYLEQNAGIVISTLERYRYKPNVVKMNARCFSQLKRHMEKEKIPTFDISTAWRWCEDVVAKTAKRPFFQALLRLADVYAYGRVLSSHLSIHGDLSEEFANAIDSFMDSLSNKGFIDSSFARYRENCSLFFRYCQLNGASHLEEIDFAILGSCHAFIVESEGHEACEGCTERMLMYLAESHGIKYGYALFLHYARFERCSSIKDLSPEGIAAIEMARGVKGTISSREFCSFIPEFINGIESYNYASNTTHAHFYHLNLLGIFLEYEDLDYSRKIADTWADDLCVRFFGKTRLNAFRHTLDLFDAFITNGRQAPKSIHAPFTSTYLTLPDWCKTVIDSYAAMRKKSGLRETTVRKETHACAKFCRFIVSEGLSSFDDLQARHIKSFNLQDEHKTVAGKNRTNQVIYHFLIHMEFQGIIKSVLHDAIPCCTARTERIVTVLSIEDKERLEDYCDKASKPIELRDAAMFKLAMNTALRGVDIISLDMKDINWKEKSIRIIQQKTGVEHLHPVDNGTLNAVFRYIRDGRSKNADTTKVFVSAKAPFGALSDSESCRNALRRAGVSVAEFHRLRRSYATDSLRGGATFKETAELLGHSGTGSVHKYALLDDDRMRLCPLSLEETGIVMDGRYRHE